MKNIFRREFFLFIGGILSLGLLWYFVDWKVKLQSNASSLTDNSTDELELPDEAYKPQYRLESLVFSVDRKRKTVCAHNVETGELVWESGGEDKFIVPGAAFPIDLSTDGELWVANVGRKRLEQLDPQTGKFIAFWEPTLAFGGCCNPVRFAVLSGGRVVTMEKGMRQACIYQPSGELDQMISDELSNSEFNYFLYRTDDKVNVCDIGTKQQWEVA